MTSFDILCLANSYKRRGTCFAGLRVDGGGWIRPVAQTAHGELYRQHFVLNDGSRPQLFDVVRISFDGPKPQPHQPENWLIRDEPWQLVSRGLRNEFAPLLQAQLHSHTTLFGDTSRRIAVERFAAEPTLSSLALIQPLDLRWDIYRTPENAHKPRALFEYGGPSYRLPVTDLAWMDTFRALSPGPHPLEACAVGPDSTILLTISLSEPWEDGCCYKLVSAIVLVPRDFLLPPQEPMQPPEAAWIIDSLANGIDPYTSEPLPGDGPLANPDTIKALQVASAALKAAPPRKRKRALPEHAGKAWDRDEDERLTREFDKGMNTGDMAHGHGRTRGAIRARLVRLGKIDPDSSL